MGQFQTVDDHSFAEQVEASRGLVVVDYTAAWCPPCRLLTPLLEQLAAEYGPRLQIVTVDADANPGTGARFGLRSLPTLLFFRDGVEVDRLVGAVPIGPLRARFEINIAAAAI